MKKILIILATALMFIATGFTQTKAQKKAALELERKDREELYGGSFKKTIIDSTPDSYAEAGTPEQVYLKDSVKIENGHEEKVKIWARGMFPKVIWDAYVIKYNSTEKLAFDHLVFVAALHAQLTLKNPQSFVPLQNQLIIWDSNKFICKFKMMGRNDYGNEIETTTIVNCD